MPQPSDESNREFMEEIQRKSDQNQGGESPAEMQLRIAEEHAKKLKASIEGQQLSHVPEEDIDSIDAQIRAANGDYVPDPPSKPVTTEPREVAPFTGKAGEILKKCAVSGEPVFILRAKDIFSVMVIAKYLEIVESYGPSDHEFQATIVNTLQNFKDWQAKNIDKVRYPD